MSGLKDTGDVYTQWGTKAGQNCTASYNLADQSANIAQVSAVCR